MPKIRLFFKEKLLAFQPLVLDREKDHYLRNVMRKKNGDEIYIFNENEEWHAKISCQKKMKIIPISMVKESKEIPDIWLCFAMIKSKNLSYIVQKVSEIGLKKIIPITTTFSEKFTPNYSRLKKIAIESVEQSEGMVVPKIEKSINLHKLLANWDKERVILFCDEKREGKDFSQIKIKRFKKIGIFIGPVGGWSNEDKRKLKNLNYINISLGENILKVDTACIVSLAGVRNLL